MRVECSLSVAGLSNFFFSQQLLGWSLNLDK